MKHLSSLILFSCLVLAACSSSPWKTYRDRDVGISIGYPKEYVAETRRQELPLSRSGSSIVVQSVLIGDGRPNGHALRIYRTSDRRILEYLQSDKPFTGTQDVNDVRYQTFIFDGRGDPFGYVTEKDGMFYVLESTWGPRNQITEKMLQSLTFL